jgi:hypothetical protein
MPLGLTRNLSMAGFVFDGVKRSLAKKGKHTFSFQVSTLLPSFPVNLILPLHKFHNLNFYYFSKYEICLFITTVNMQKIRSYHEHVF